MEYSKIIAVSGLPGLHELISNKTDGAIVRSLEDKSTRFISSRIHNFSHLESIEIYTVTDNVNLVDILLSMQKSSKAIPDTKDNAAIKNYFTEVYPDIDFERVYSSDMKKIIKWFEVLHANKIEIKLTEPVAEEEEIVVKKAAAPEDKVPFPLKEKGKAAKEVKAPAKEVKEEIAEEAPKKKAAAPKKKVVEKEEEKPAKPVKKAATKAAKETKEKEDAPKKKAASKKK